MEFDKTRIMTYLDDDLEQWIGWKGFLADSILNLKRFVLGNLPETVEEIEEGLFVSSGVHYQLFYPVEPPKEKQEPKYRPCKTFEELALSANNGHYSPYKGDDEKLRQYNIFNALRDKAVYDKDAKEISVIHKINFDNIKETGLGLEELRIAVGGRYVSLNILFKEYEWADKTGNARIIGVKEDI